MAFDDIPEDQDDDHRECKRAIGMLEADVQRLRDAIKLIECQDQGCGGNLKPEEIYQAMQRIARETLRTQGEKP
jgi:hypothetical protein